MSSNSVRVGAEIFEAAREHGQIMSRSAALQIEHWARLGRSLEASGLSVADLSNMLRAQPGAPSAAAASDPDPVVVEVSEDALWSCKRAKQARDLEMIRSGRATNEQMSWFSGGLAKAAKAVNSPY